MRYKYQIGGNAEDLNSSEFFSQVAGMLAQRNQQQQPEEPEIEGEATEVNDSGNDDYEALQSRIDELEARLGDQSPKGLEEDYGDEFMNLLFSEDTKMPADYSNVSASENVPVGQKEVEAYEFFTQEKGLPDHVAAGIVGNLKHESNFNVNAVGDGGIAKGLAQWHPDRYNRLKAKGHDLSSFRGNLEAIYDELNTTEKGAFNKLLSTHSAEEAAAIFDQTYERSAGKSRQQRINSASSLLNKVKRKYQFGGMPQANTKRELTEGLNNPNFDNLQMNLPEKYNLIRGLDNGQPVAITDQLGTSKVLHGPHDIASMYGKVNEIRL